MNTTDLIEFDNCEEWDGLYRISECKRALSPSGLPDIDYALNPYGGCEHGCVYCYAPEVLHTEWRDWRVVKVRSNIATRLSAELKGLSGVVGIGTVTDPYQYAEKRFMLTRMCLDVLSRKEMGVHIHTKSDLILRDREVLKDLNAKVGITITTLDERISKMTEPGAPLPNARINTLKELTSDGIDTYALIGPILNHLEGKEEEFVNAINSTGTKVMYLDSLNSRPLLSERLDRMKLKSSDTAKQKIRSLGKEMGLDVRNVF